MQSGNTEALVAARGALVSCIDKHGETMHSLFQQLNVIDWSRVLSGCFDNAEFSRRLRLERKLQDRTEELADASSMLNAVESRLPADMLPELRRSQGLGEVAPPTQAVIVVPAASGSLTACDSLIREAAANVGGALNCLIKARDIIVSHINHDMANMKQLFQHMTIIDWRCLLAGAMDGADAAERHKASDGIQQWKRRLDSNRATLAKIEGMMPDHIVTTLRKSQGIGDLY